MSLDAAGMARLPRRVPSGRPDDGGQCWTTVILLRIRRPTVPSHARSHGQTRALTVAHETSAVAVTCVSAGLTESSRSRTKLRLGPNRATLSLHCARAEAQVMAGPGDEITAGAGGHSHLRASHVDREQAIEVLKAAFVQGRLGKDEFDLRVGQVLASRTYADLAVLTGDIPAALTRAQPREL